MNLSPDGVIYTVVGFIYTFLNPEPAWNLTRPKRIYKFHNGVPLSVDKKKNIAETPLP